MLAAIAAQIFDPLGYIELDVDPSSGMHERRRRVNRVATLDGAAVFNDFGWADADMTIVLRWRPVSRSIEAAVYRMVQLYGMVTLATEDGCFMAAIEKYTTGEDVSTLTLLVAEKLSA